MIRSLLLLVVTAILVIFSFIAGACEAEATLARSPGEHNAARANVQTAVVFAVVAALAWLAVAFGWPS